MNLKDRLESAVYRLKRRFGVTVIYKRFVREESDIASGNRALIFDDITLTRVPIMEAKSYRDFEYDLSYIAANKNFTYGGVINRISRLAIISAKDITFTPNKKDRLVYRDIEYLVAEIYPSYEDISFVLALGTSLSE